MPQDQKNNFPIKLFITASLMTLVLFATLLLVFKQSISPRSNTSSQSKDTYYLKHSNAPKNDYATKNASLEDILAGPIITNLDPNMGNEKAKVSIVMFTDFSCEFCSKEEAVIKKIVEEYKDKVRYIRKDYPENDKTSVSWQAAVAARCARAQGNFWPYHDLLVKNSSQMDTKLLTDLAGQLKLNASDFKNCQKDEAVSSLVKDNVDEANSLGINGVPFIFVNDKEFLGQMDYDELKQTVDMELKISK
jgi:protein-disulfide isomerase